MNLNNYLCSTEQLYLAYKLSSLDFISFDLGLGTKPRTERLIMVGPEGEVRLIYEPIGKKTVDHSLVVIVADYPWKHGFRAPFGFSPPPGEYGGRAWVVL